MLKLIGFILITAIFLQTQLASASIVILGDSLTEGYGVTPEQSFPTQLQKLIDKNKGKMKVKAAGVSGSTTASAPSRMQWLLRGDKPKVVMLALGSNDGLRGLAVDLMSKNLSKAIHIAKKAGVEVILCQFKAPPNYGKEYGDKFAAAFAQIAKENEVSLMPFFLQKVAGRPELNIEDGIHPNEKGHQIIAQDIYDFLKKHSALKGEL